MWTMTCCVSDFKSGLSKPIMKLKKKKKKKKKEKDSEL